MLESRALLHHSKGLTMTNLKADIVMEVVWILRIGLIKKAIDGNPKNVSFPLPGTRKRKRRENPNLFSAFFLSPIHSNSQAYLIHKIPLGQT